MALVLYVGLLAVSSAYALRDWRRGWTLIILCASVQDPVRKLTPGSPVLVSFLIVVLYGVLLFSARGSLRAGLGDFSRRFPAISNATVVFLLFLVLAGVNGLFTFGIGNWRLPALSLFTYIAPVPAVVLGFMFLDREERLYSFFRAYALLTAIALTGTYLEYARVESRMLGLVGVQGDYIRHFIGIQVRLLSGFYRSPDIMSWHAATLTAIAVAMAVRAGLSWRGYTWAATAGWAFTACMMGGRRKAIYYVVVFCAVFLWRYLRRLEGAQVVAFAAVILLAVGVIRHIASRERTSAYAAGARTTLGEVIQRLDGGVVETFRQNGLLGAGLGAATQGSRHLAVQNVRLGWQEGGLAKLAAEIGLPGLIAAALLVLLLVRLSLRLTSIGDVRGSSQFLRVTLFALVIANVANFMASAQAYSDPVLTLMAAFFGGSLLATATLDERAIAESRITPALVPASA